MTDKPASYLTLLSIAISNLEQEGIENARLDARILMQYASGLSHARLISSGDEIVCESVKESFNKSITRRVGGEPVHRIIGEREFFGRAFKLSPETLVPRDDTEVLIEQTLLALGSGSKPKTMLEIGTGSGIIAITIASENPNVKVLATDISDDALKTAQENAGLYEVANRVAFAKHNMFEAVDGKFDLIVSNPPYIPAADIENLSIEVREHDPVAALDGGGDGLDFYREIFSKGLIKLETGGQILVEIGVGQSVDVTDLARASGSVDIRYVKDLNGIDRVIHAKY